jgi:adenine/guanine phosphoribosyltransferase-like PRPP-binding protein
MSSFNNNNNNTTTTSNNSSQQPLVSTEDAVLTRLFEHYQIFPPGSRVAMPLTDFVPPLTFEDVHAIARLMVEAVPSWEGVTCICGLADRSAGSIVHVMSQLTGIPYTLANWYPKGSTGAIVVKENFAGFSGEGPVLINGIGRGDRVVFADICIRGGSTALEIVEALVKAGVTVTHAVFGCDFSDQHGMANISEVTAAHGQFVPCSAVGTIMVHGKCAGTPDPASSRPDVRTTLFKRNLLKGRIIGRTNPPASIPPPRPLEWQPLSMVEACFRRALKMFVGVPIYFAEGSTYPYSNFSLTDFIPVMDSARVEDIADCMAFLSPLLRRISRIHASKISTEGHFVNRQQSSASSNNNLAGMGTPTTSFASLDESEYILVSESDRGGGPLAVALSRRTGLSFTMANWSSSVGDTGGVEHTSNVGYSGTGTLFLNGIPKGAKCIVVDDMLSSGGTCEGLLKAIEAAGGVPVECLFASEKVTTLGRDRLRKTWKDLPLISVCYFSSESKTETISAPPTEMGNETPIQKRVTQDGNAGDRRQRD